MIWDDLKKLKTAPGDLRKFGLLVGAVFLGLGLFFLARHKAHYLFLLVPGGTLFLLGLVYPRCLKQVYVGWMALAMALGFVVSHVVLGVFFFLVVTPIGLAARCAGKDFLRLKREPTASTYWIRRDNRSPRSAKDYENQF